VRNIKENPWEVALVLVALIGMTTAVALFEEYPGTDRMSDAVNAMKVFAALAGGAWVLYQFTLRRAFESALVMKVAVRAEPLGSRCAVFIAVRLLNAGKRRIVAAQRLTDAQKTDYENSIEFPCDLVIRKLAAVEPAPEYFDWWGDNMMGEWERESKHVPVLAEYSTADGDIDFFMEPKERYSLGHAFALPAGHYMAKVVFVGTRAGAAEYWSQMVYFHIPVSKDRQERVQGGHANE
jgi:hypothetical protein